MQDLPDGGAAEGSAVVLERSLDVIDGKVLLAQGQDEFADGVFLGLGAGAGLEVAEEIGLRATEMMAEDTKGAGGIAESLGDQWGRDALDEVGAEGLVLAVSGEAGSRKKRASLVNRSGELSTKTNDTSNVSDVNGKVATTWPMVLKSNEFAGGTDV